MAKTVAVRNGKPSAAPSAAASATVRPHRPPPGSPRIARWRPDLLDGVAIAGALGMLVLWLYTVFH